MQRLDARRAENERMMSEIGNGLYEKRQLEHELSELQRQGAPSSGYSANGANLSPGSGATIHSQHGGTIELNTPSVRMTSEVSSYSPDRTRIKSACCASPNCFEDQAG